MNADSAESRLTRLGESALYAPADKQTWVFLLWDATSPPGSFPLEETWSDQGAPRRLGWFVFLLALPSPAQAPERERALRESLSAPAATGLAWAGDPDDAPDTGGGLRGVVSVRPDDDGRPVIAADAPVILPPGLLAVGFPGGFRLAASRGEAGELDGVTATRPAYEDQPWIGMTVPLAGPRAGCVTFTAMLHSAVDGDSSTKRAAEVWVDPLRPFDPRRTRTSPTGAAYTLIAEPEKHYRLVPVASAPDRDRV